MNKHSFLKIFSAVFLIFQSILLFSCGEDAEAKIEYAPFEQDKLIRSVDGPGEPKITDEYILFTADPKYRTVGIAFDFEDYQIIHPFQVYFSTDEDGKKTPKHLFYCYKRQHKITTINYRLVIEGLWTTDPLNPNKVYDDDINLYFSVVEDVDSIKYQTEQLEDGTIHFIYKGEEGEYVQLAGTFCNWDPWIYTMQETYPGFYELTLPLPCGTYYYNYYIGMTPVMDDTNPEKAFAKSDNRMVSVITVK